MQVPDIRGGGRVAMNMTPAAKQPKKAKKEKKEKKVKEPEPVTASTVDSGASHTHDKGYNKWAKFDIVSHLRCVTSFRPTEY